MPRRHTSGRSNGVTSRRLDRAAVLFGVAAFACSCSTHVDSREPSPPSSPPPAAATSRPPSAQPILGVSTLTTPTTTPTGVIPAGACESSAPSIAVAAVNTIAVTFPDPESFDAVVIARPDVACPGDVVEFEIQVQNLTDQRRRFMPNYGLLLVPGGPTKFELAPIALDLESGATVTTIVSAVIPPQSNYAAACATLWLGIGDGSGRLCILDPATVDRD